MPKIEARLMTAADARRVWMMVEAEPADYVAGFIPFANLNALLAALASAVKDIYRTLFRDGALVGFFMLRGIDKGFARPSFGVYVASHAAGRGVARFALEMACGLGRSLGLSALFLTVDSANARALALYEQNGFMRIGVHPETGHLMMERVLRS
jgi:RimJ/RimL family protein N-acetyltransferase